MSEVGESTVICKFSTKQVLNQHSWKYNEWFLYVTYLFHVSSDPK